MATVGTVLVDALVLAGGKSSRLGSAPKAALLLDGQTLLERTVAAVANARHTVVVGPETGLKHPVLWAREHPPFTGPAAAIAAGLDALAGTGETLGDFTLVLACDMPRIALAVPLLLAAVTDSPERDGAIAISSDESGDRIQPLAAAYSSTRLRAAIETHRRGASLESLPMHRLIDGLDLTRVHVLAGSTDDVDTWADAVRLGVRPQNVSEVPANIQAMDRARGERLERR